MFGPILESALNPQSPLKQLPFGIRGLSAPSIEMLDRRGLLRELEVPKRLKDPHANPVQGLRRQVGHFAGIPLLAGNIDPSQWTYRLPSSTDTSLICEMQELETVLTQRAEASGVKIRPGHCVTHFHQTGDGVTVAAGYSAHVDIVDPERLKPGRNSTSRGMYLQSQPGYLALQDFDGGAFHGTHRPVSLEHLQEVLRRISNTDVTIGTLHVASTWTDRARQATTYRDGRVFLAGDAAHIHAPLGGQGLNLGLGDVMNLGWKLAAAIQNRAPEGLLDTYQAERYPVGARVLDWSRAQVLVMRPDPHARTERYSSRPAGNTRWSDLCGGTRVGYYDVPRPRRQ